MKLNLFISFENYGLKIFSTSQTFVFIAFVRSAVRHLSYQSRSQSKSIIFCYVSFTGRIILLSGSQTVLHLISVNTTLDKIHLLLHPEKM